jgi:hypothetical protein
MAKGLGVVLVEHGGGGGHRTKHGDDVVGFLSTNIYIYIGRRNP